jgi:hypothetical protein
VIAHLEAMPALRQVDLRGNRLGTRKARKKALKALRARGVIVETD